MYTAEINRRQPACLLLLIDQSYSMSEQWRDDGASKADALALAVNRILGNAVLLCSKGDERIYDYFEVGIVGYGESVGPILHGSNSSRPVLPIGELARNPKRVDQVMRKMPDGAGGIMQTPLSVPVWIDPVANGSTPMVAAFRTAEQIVASWCGRNQRSFPPIVINITDGASTDGDPSEGAGRVRMIQTDDGPVLLFNLHLSAAAREPVNFPSSSSALPDSYAAMLFGMSSELPASMAEAAASLGYRVSPGARGFLYNAEATAVIEFLDIGTRAVTPTGLKELTAGAG